jgi:hypothetical protein
VRGEGEKAMRSRPAIRRKVGKVGKGAGCEIGEAMHIGSAEATTIR